MLNIQLLGDDPAASAPSPAPASAITFTPAQEKAILSYVKTHLDVQQRVADLKATKSSHFWGAVTGLATAITATIGVVAFIHSRQERDR